MKCRHFGECGSCTLYAIDYKTQLEEKHRRLAGLLAPFYEGEVETYSSPDTHYRARAEFRIWHERERCDYAMGNRSKDGSVVIEECPKVIRPIEERMEPLLEAVNGSAVLSRKLFAVEFLAATTGECLITMLYHRQLDEAWQREARALEEQLNASIIGRARKQRLVLSRDYVTEVLKIDSKKYRYRHYEGGFTQPNPFVNRKMIEWAKARTAEAGGGDLLEAYCGLGNFTIPLAAECFEKVLATEISKNSINAAKENCALNGVENIAFVRLSSEEMTSALRKERSFNRLKGIDIDEYDFHCVLVDPPRAGLDEATRELISTFENIIYISCNPETLARDLEHLSTSHEVQKAALFDQFPHTGHMESGVFLRVRNGETSN